MTKPIRWSDAASDADPVLRAVMRYAQDIEPSTQDVVACAAAVARAESPPEPSVNPKPTSLRARWSSWSRGAVHRAVALAIVGAGGAALGMTLTPFFHGSRPAVAESASSPKTRAPSPLTPRVPVESPTPVPMPSAPSVAARSRPVPIALAAPVTSAAASAELTLLAEARKERGTQPARALALLAAHARQFPDSAFAEERAALRIEVLFALGRNAEAEHEYAAFDTRFSNSIYELRLNAVRKAALPR